MSRQLHAIHAFTVSAMAFVFSVTAQAGASRTFVATTGNDSNTTVNCGATTPCRTFGAALGVTNAGGEIVVLSSGGYGPATISQPVIIGVDASISVTTSGGNGLTIDTSGNVTLIGLNLHGEATGNDGVLVNQVGFLRLYNMLIENFANDGVEFPVTGKLAVYGSTINDNAELGVFINNSSAAAYVHDSSFDHNNIGVGLMAGHATVSDSSAQYNQPGGAFGAFGTSTLTLFNDRAAFNNVALGSGGTGVLYFADCLITNNTTAYSVGSGSTIAGTSPGTSLIAPSQTMTGTLGTPIALQ